MSFTKILLFVLSIGNQIAFAQYNPYWSHESRQGGHSVQQQPFYGSTSSRNHDDSVCQNEMNSAKLLVQVERASNAISDTKKFIQSEISSGSSWLNPESPKKLLSLTNEAVSSAVGLSKLLDSYKPQCIAQSSDIYVKSAVSKLKDEENELSGLVTSFLKNSHDELSAADALFPVLEKLVMKSAKRLLIGKESKKTG